MKNYAFILYVLILAVLQTACSQEEKNFTVQTEDLPPQKTETFSAGGQNFTIIPFYEETLDYIEVVEENSLLNTLGTYRYTVKDPMLDRMSEQKMILNMDIPASVTITQRINELKEKTAQLIRDQDKTNAAIQGALDASTGLLSGGDKTFYVLPVNPDLPMEGMGGVAAWTLDENVILLLLDPSYKEDRLSYTIAHEYHHAVSMESDPIYDSLLDFVLFEGKGDAFAQNVYPDVKIPWTTKVKDIELEVAFSQLEAAGMTAEMELYHSWELGDPAMNIPRWANYKMGNLIMQSYLENHPGVPIGEWTSLGAEELVRESDYEKLLADF
ncbi:hypothetical protein BHE18_03885 [Rossellomorea aquimaris]|uniref:DUF2268 domain-containing protein n=2 Tax=Rossellomorea aquimaris TaxID=189382 RepID=A0A1J6W100_9BACI|nr:hypothetical protein BHE18_03885 [Rossellomorea aquimaris]